MWVAWLCAAIAGTIRVHAPTPVTYRLDGEVVGRLVTDVTLTEVPAGTHRIEVVDTFGAVLAAIDIVLRDGQPLWFDYMNRRLVQVDLAVDREALANRTTITDVQFRWLEHRINKKRKDDKRLKRLAENVDSYWFQMRHVDSLLLAFGTIEARVTAAQKLAPRTVDPEKTRAIEDHFPPGNYRDRALGAFAIYQ